MYNVNMDVHTGGTAGATAPPEKLKMSFYIVLIITLLPILIKLFGSNYNMNIQH